MMPLDARLLAALRAAPAHLSSNELAQQLGASAETIENHVRELREAGFDIELRPGFGYRLLSAPDRIIADDLLSRLGGECLLFREILVLEETGSTNDHAAQLGRRGAEGGLVIFAERQTAGRGRFGRRWESASHRGLWFSLLLRPELPPAQWPRLTTWAAAGVAAAVEKETGCRAAIKWPNDVYLSGKKSAGILIESALDAQLPFAVIGIGVNVNHRSDDFPAELRSTATSLREAAGRPVDRAALAATLLRELDARAPLLGGRFAEIISEAAQRSLLLGRWITVQAGDNSLEGIAEALDEDGQLLLRRSDGTLDRLSAGEVTLQPR